MHCILYLGIALSGLIDKINRESLTFGALLGLTGKINCESSAFGALASSE